MLERDAPGFTSEEGGESPGPAAGDSPESLVIDSQQQVSCNDQVRLTGCDRNIEISSTWLNPPIPSHGSRGLQISDQTPAQFPSQGLSIQSWGNIKSPNLPQQIPQTRIFTFEK